ncbi:major capsid protein [Desulfosarcina sp. OttesenSCG-928-A07]|nr:major capsid protein [Desulfosarcina sp. OttesenSCG-928-G17]MDL2329080.1 major capsid protein [Desulfosarcina sp. OttesenSCG-928-A07]
MANLNHPNLFTAVELTDAVNKLPVIPLRLGRLFEEKGVKTTNVVFDVKQGRLFLVENQDRSAAPKDLADRGPKRSVKILECAHLPLTTTLRPEDVQDVRAFGQDEPVGVESVVNDKMQELKNPIEMTIEYHRLGAIKGVVMDADGVSELHNLYNVFGITKKAISITFPDNVPVKTNPVLKSLLDAKRHIEQKRSGLVISRFEALVGSDFYDALTGHELIREPFELWQSNLSNYGDNDYRKRGFTYAGITFLEVSDQVGGQPLINPAKAHLYPVAPGMFKTYYAPANWMSTVNTVGRQYYAQMEELEMDRGYQLEVQSNPLCVCMFPETLVELTAA